MYDLYWNSIDTIPNQKANPLQLFLLLGRENLLCESLRNKINCTLLKTKKILLKLSTSTIFIMNKLYLTRIFYNSIKVFNIDQGNIATEQSWRFPAISRYLVARRYYSRLERLMLKVHANFWIFWIWINASFEFPGGLSTLTSFARNWA